MVLLPRRHTGSLDLFVVGFYTCFLVTFPSAFRQFVDFLLLSSLIGEFGFHFLFLNSTVTYLLAVLLRLQFVYV